MQKAFSVDWDSFGEVSTLFGQVKARYWALRKLTHPEELSRKQRNQELFDACTAILETDIASVYHDMALDSTPRYYVYAHLDSNHKIFIDAHGITSFAAVLGCSHFPFYIGKGTGNRCAETTRNGEHAKINKRPRLVDLEIGVHKIRDDLTESAALQLEAKLIDIFGLRPYGGLLANLDEGLRAPQRRAMYRDAFLKLRPFNAKLE